MGASHNHWSWQLLHLWWWPGGRGFAGPPAVGHRRGGHLKLTGSNTFAMPRNVARPLGWGNPQVATSSSPSGDETPKSNTEFRDMFIKKSWDRGCILLTTVDLKELSWQFYSDFVLLSCWPTVSDHFIDQFCGDKERSQKKLCRDHSDQDTMFIHFSL